MCHFDVTPITLVVAMGLHSIFEGIALGLMDSFKSFLNLAIGVILHSPIASISLTVNLA